MIWAAGQILRKRTTEQETGGGAHLLLGELLLTLELLKRLVLHVAQIVLVHLVQRLKTTGRKSDT